MPPVGAAAPAGQARRRRQRQRQRHPFGRAARWSCRTGGRPEDDLSVLAEREAAETGARRLSGEPRRRPRDDPGRTVTLSTGNCLFFTSNSLRII